MQLKTVFVHLGPANARHLWANIRRFNEIFPDQPTAIIFSDTRHIKEVNANKNEIYIYRSTLEDDLTLNSLAHNMNFRQGFWRYSIERFYALRKFHELNPSSSLLHLESDVLALPGFPFESFQRIKNLAWEKFNDTHDVSAVMYLRNPEDTNWLTEKLTSALSQSENLTDMTALSLLSNKFPERISLLPRTSHDEDFQIFKGIFDGAPIGMWLNGRDPRNHRGFIKRYLPLPEADVDASQLQYKCNADGSIIAINSVGDHFNIYNLHIHSKRLALFGPQWKLFLGIDINTSSQRHLGVWFSPLVFLRLSWNFLRTHIRLQVNLL